MVATGELLWSPFTKEQKRTEEAGFYTPSNLALGGADDMIVHALRDNRPAEAEKCLFRSARGGPLIPQKSKKCQRTNKRT